MMLRCSLVWDLKTPPLVRVTSTVLACGSSSARPGGFDLDVMINAIAVAFANLISPTSRKLAKALGNGCEREDASKREGRA
jgi:hypothetical protein